MNYKPKKKLIEQVIHYAKTFLKEDLDTEERKGIEKLITQYEIRLEAQEK
jgi:hypothetical protein